MAKSHIDINGFKVIEAMPISRVGVFPYLGEQIDFDGSLELEPKRVYYVLRSPEELFAEEAISSFNGKPFIDNHEMLGKDFTKVDNRPADGTIYNVRQSKDMPDYLIADTNIFTEKMIKKIASGKRELSLGYRCEYVPEVGIYRGEHYDFIQKHLRGNHLALVEHGRCGSNVCVCDGALITLDQLPKELESMGKEEKEERLRTKLTSCLKGDDEQGCQDALDFLDLPPAKRKAALDWINGKDCGGARCKPTQDEGDGEEDDIPEPPPPDMKDGEEEGDAQEEETNEDSPSQGTEDEASDAEEPSDEDEECIEDNDEADGEGEGAEEEAPVVDGRCDKECGCDEGEGSVTTPSATFPSAKGASFKDQGKCQKGTKVRKEKVDEGEKEPAPHEGESAKGKVLTQDQLDDLIVKIRKDYARAQSLARAVGPLVGAFDSSDMTEAQVARFAVKRIPALSFATDAPTGVMLGALRGHLASMTQVHDSNTVKIPTSDEAIAQQENVRSLASELRDFLK